MNSNEKNTPAIHSLNELVTALTEEERTTYSQIIHSLKLDNKELNDYCSWSKDCYTRNCIIENEKFELILLCWEPNQATPIHDHGGEECWVKILDGNFSEIIYQEESDGTLKEVKSTQAITGDVTYMIDFMGSHSLTNLDETRSMSLHLYAKPIRTCNIYDVDENKFVSKNMAYDTISNKH